MKRKTGVLSFLLIVLSVLFVFTGVKNVEAAVKVKLNKKTIKIEQQKSYTLKLKGAKKKNVKWSSSDKKIASVKKGTVKAKKVGSCVITAKYRGKKYKCKVTVVTNNPKQYSGAVKLFRGSTGFDKETGITVLRTAKELNAYRESLKKTKAAVYAGEEEKKYLNLLGRYDASYFRKHSLILVSEVESSGSNWISYDGITYENGHYVVRIKREVPEIGDCMMIYWQILIETDNKAITKQNIKLQTETITEEMIED